MLLDEREAAAIGTAPSEVLMVGAVESVPQAAIDATAKALRNLIEWVMKPVPEGESGHKASHPVATRKHPESQA
jgi:hypothetical protein